MKRLFAIAGMGLFGLLWLAACGSQGPAGTEVKVHLVAPFGGTGTGRVIYQVADGSWQAALEQAPGVYALTLPAGEKRYGVAVNCLPTGWELATFGYARVFQLTVDDTTDLRVGCTSLSDIAQYSLTEAPIEVESSESGYNRVWLRSAWSAKKVGLGTPKPLTFLTRPRRDLLIVAYDSGSSKYAPRFIKRIKLVRDLDASTPPVCATPCSYALTSADTPAIASVENFSLPAWADQDPWFGVGFVSKKGLVVPHGSDDPDNDPALGTGDHSGGDYYLIPDTEAGDVYWAEASAKDAAGTYRASNVKVLDHDGGDIAFALPTAKFDPSVSDHGLPRFGFSSYGTSGLVGYAFVAEFGDFTEFAVVSPGWLGGRTTYQVPDLSGAPGFAGARPLPGEKVHWQGIAIVANRPLGEILSAEPLPLPHPLPRLPGLELRLASKQGHYTH